MTNETIEFLSEVSTYYSSKLEKHGTTALGVDWNSKNSQFIRFDQLSKIIKEESKFTLNDVGCGYGAFYDYLNKKYRSFSYFGIDISEMMITAARKRYKNKNNVQFIRANEPNIVADYTIASGIFNVRLEKAESEWYPYIENLLDVFNEKSKIGFAFNCLTSYSDGNKMRNHLYYADPAKLFELCKRKYARNVALLHDYDLYEFTILVKKWL